MKGSRSSSFSARSVASSRSSLRPTSGSKMQSSQRPRVNTGYRRSTSYYHSPGWGRRRNYRYGYGGVCTGNGISGILTFLVILGILFDGGFIFLAILILIIYSVSKACSGNNPYNSNQPYQQGYYSSPPPQGHSPPPQGYSSHPLSYQTNAPVQQPLPAQHQKGASPDYVRPKPRYCPACGMAITPGDVFCQECGVAIA